MSLPIHGIQAMNLPIRWVLPSHGGCARADRFQPAGASGGYVTSGEEALLREAMGGLGMAPVQEEVEAVGCVGTGGGARTATTRGIRDCRVRFSVPTAAAAAAANDGTARYLLDAGLVLQLWSSLARARRESIPAMAAPLLVVRVHRLRQSVHSISAGTCSTICPAHDCSEHSAMASCPWWRGLVSATSAPGSPIPLIDRNKHSQHIFVREDVGNSDGVFLAQLGEGE